MAVPCAEWSSARRETPAVTSLLVMISATLAHGVNLLILLGVLIVVPGDPETGGAGSWRRWL